MYVHFPQRFFLLQLNITHCYKNDQAFANFTCCQVHNRATAMISHYNISFLFLWMAVPCLLFAIVVIDQHLKVTLHVGMSVLCAYSTYLLQDSLAQALLDVQKIRQLYSKQCTIQLRFSLVILVSPTWKYKVIVFVIPLAVMGHGSGKNWPVKTNRDDSRL